MRRHSILVLTAVLGVMAVGCTSSDETASTETEASPSPSAGATSTGATTSQPFDQPLVGEKADAKGKDGKGKDAKAGKKTQKVAGLLQSTDPDERAKRVQATIKGTAGADPFASLPDDKDRLLFSSPVINPNGGSGVASNPNGPIGAPGGGGRSPLGSLPGGGSSPYSGNPGGGITLAKGPGAVPAIPAFPEANEIRPPQPRRPLIARGPSGVPISPANPGGNPGLNPLPAIPEPTLAKAVEVTGVITVGGVTQAIIKAPNEPTSRHVIVGQRLSNGQVLVKRIEANSGGDPIVIFEENGVEVARAVGEKAAPNTPGGPTAMVVTGRLFV